jgi:hypothetical protein
MGAGHFSCVSTERPSEWSSRLSRKTPVRFAVILALAPMALAGCNVNQTPNPSGQAKLSKVYYPYYNAYDPTKYGQTSGFYAGR